MRSASRSRDAQDGYAPPDATSASCAGDPPCRSQRAAPRDFFGRAPRADRFVPLVHDRLRAPRASNRSGATEREGPSCRQARRVPGQEKAWWSWRDRGRQPLRQQAPVRARVPVPRPGDASSSPARAACAGPPPSPAPPPLRAGSRRAPAAGASPLPAMRASPRPCAPWHRFPPPRPGESPNRLSPPHRGTPAACASRPSPSFCGPARRQSSARSRTCA